MCLNQPIAPCRAASRAPSQQVVPTPPNGHNRRSNGQSRLARACAGPYSAHEVPQAARAGRLPRPGLASFTGTCVHRRPHGRRGTVRAAVARVRTGCGDRARRAAHRGLDGRPRAHACRGCARLVSRVVRAEQRDPSRRRRRVGEGSVQRGGADIRTDSGAGAAGPQAEPPAANTAARTRPLAVRFRTSPPSRAPRTRPGRPDAAGHARSGPERFGRGRRSKARPRHAVRG